MESNQDVGQEQAASSRAAFFACRSASKLWHVWHGQESAAASCRPRLTNPSQANAFVGVVHLPGACALRKAGDLNSVLIAMKVEMALQGTCGFCRARLPWISLLCVCGAPCAIPHLR